MRDRTSPVGNRDTYWASFFMSKATPKLSVIIPTFNEPVSLWHTFYSFTEQLNGLGEMSEIIVGNNGKDNLTTKSLEDAGVHVVRVFPTSTSMVRNIPAEMAMGEILCFADTHVCLQEGSIKKALQWFDKDENLGALFGATRFEFNQEPYYHAKLKDSLHLTFCNDTQERGNKNGKPPYAIAASGHGMYFVRKSAFDHIGGYFDEQDGYGGEEVGLCLLLWMYGYSVYLDPNMYHWHLPGSYRACAASTGPMRNGRKMIVNNLIAAYIVGGQKWLDTVYENFKKYDMFGLENHYKEIPEMCKERRDKVVREAEYDLDTMLESFEVNEVAM